MKSKSAILTAMLLTGLAAGTMSLRADEKLDDHKAHKDAEAKLYPAATCLISGEKLDSMGKPVVMVVDGQQIKFCCKNCVKDYDADKAGYMKKLAKAEADAKPYTLITCVVSGDEFDHGKPYIFAYEGQQVKLCCTDCLADFKKEPAKYVKKIAESQKSADQK